MTDASRTHVAVEFLGSARFAQALATTGIALAALVFPTERLIGWAGLISALCALIVLMALSFVARRPAIEWRGILPITLLAYLGWAAVSLVWSEYRWST
ncbi:MAG TPA: exopolysaccharide production protein, partial [Pseudolysinimonas sp.]|nr:exopolysaccharide production protein [Pseudolysinimonas sp.]